MDFRISSSKKIDKNMVSVPKETVESLISLLSNVECTCVFSDKHQEYFKVNDVNQEIVEELKTALALATLTNR